METLSDDARTTTMHGQSASSGDHRESVVSMIAACLAALTLITIMELLEGNHVAGPPGSTAEGSKDKGTDPRLTLRRTAQTIDMTMQTAMTEGRGALMDVQQDAGRVAEVQGQLEQAIAALGIDISRLRKDSEVLRRETNVREVDQESLSLSMRLRSGSLQSMGGLRWMESIVSSRLMADRSMSHHEKRAWRQRLVGQLLELDRQLGDETTLRKRVEEWQTKFAGVIQEWPSHFSKSKGKQRSDTRDASVAVSMDDIGFEPIYRALFAEEAVGHPSEAEGQRLHQLYNS